jgi:hypothetical protein
MAVQRLGVYRTVMSTVPELDIVAQRETMLENMEEMIIWLCHTLRRGWDGGVLMLGW